jgi:hypothetical protein
MPKYIPYLIELFVEQSKSESNLPLFNYFAFALAWSVFGYLPISVLYKNFPRRFQKNSWAVTVGVFLIAKSWKVTSRNARSPQGQGSGKFNWNEVQLDAV